MTEHQDPRGRPYIWIGGNGPTWQPATDTDRAAVDDGYVAITPLVFDLTDHDELDRWRPIATDGDDAE